MIEKMVIPMRAYVILLTLVLVTGPLQAKNLQEATLRYWGSLVSGTVVEIETVVSGPDHSSRKRDVVEVGREDGRVTVRIRTRFEGESAKIAADGHKPKASSQVERVLSWRPGDSEVIEKMWSTVDGRRGAVREERLSLALCGNRLPGFEGCCLADEVPIREETLSTPAGTFRTRVYQIGPSIFWVTAGGPPAGLIQATATVDGESVKRVVTKIVRGTVPAK